jgi:hypothetical protein
MKKNHVFFLLFLLGSLSLLAQKSDTIRSSSTKKEMASKPGPKAFKEVITKNAISQKGVFTVHFQEDKYFFEIPDSLLGREFIAVTRFAKVAAGASKYGGEVANEQTLSFEKGPDQRIFMRVVTLINTADSTQTIAKAVKNSNLDPIVAAFDIKAYGKDSNSSVIEVTEFFKGDNQAVSLNSSSKRTFSLSGLASDRSYIVSIKTYPRNIEVKTVKTFSASAGGAGPTGVLSGPGIPAVQIAGAVTLELNTSILLLPKVPMNRRLFDSRVGFFAANFTVYSDDQQKVDEQTFAVRYKLEPKAEDREKYKQGILVEPAKPIVYYIDPATPKKWVPALIKGVNDWNIAFEKAGWKNAIQGKVWPNDSTMSLEDARFSVIRYFASDIENAYGPQVHDPRSGEILESHIGWYHNVMNLVHDWYMIQTAAVDSNARKMKFEDDLMGKLIRFASSHEVGHTLGLRHNMGSSSKTPVEKLRDKEWLAKNGHTASIMDYARFNYVAQPEDSIPQNELLPHIGAYDKWAIQWGYTYTGLSDVEADKKINNKWIIEQLKNNSSLWFGGDGYGADPRAQAEDLSDNAIVASEYGIKNLKRILVNLPTWTKEEGDKYKNLNDMYLQLIGQFNKYMDHVSKNIGGVYETFKSIEELGDVYAPTPIAIQKAAMAFLQTQLFTTPKWLLDYSILNKITNPASNERIQIIQTNTLKSLLEKGRLLRLINTNTRFNKDSYAFHDMMEDTRKGIFSELTTQKPTDIFRRNLQKTYVAQLSELIKPTASNNSAPVPYRAGPADIENTDVISEVKMQLKKLAAALKKNTSNDAATQNHYDDLQDRIKKVLNSK